MRTLRHAIAILVAALSLAVLPIHAQAAGYSVKSVRIVDAATGSVPAAGSMLTADEGRTLLVDADATVTLAFDLVDEGGAAVSGLDCLVAIQGMGEPVLATYKTFPLGGSHYVAAIAPHSVCRVSLSDDLVFNIDDASGVITPTSVGLDTAGVERLGFVDGDAGALAGMEDPAGVELAVSGEGDSIVGSQSIYPTLSSSLLASADEGILPSKMNVTLTDSSGVQTTSTVSLARAASGMLRATTPVDLGGVGTFRVQTSYAYDLSPYYGFSGMPLQKATFSRSVVVDVAGPSAARIVGMPDAVASSVDSGYLYNAGRTLLFSIEDDASGVAVDDVSVGYVTRDYRGNAIETGEVPATFNGSSFKVELPANSIISLGDLTVHAHDRAGRQIQSASLVPIPFVTASGESVTRLLTTSVSQVPTRLVDFEPDASTNSWLEGIAGASVPDDVLFVSSSKAIPTVVMKVHDPLLPFFGWNPYDAGGDAARIGNAFSATRTTADPRNPLDAPDFANTDTRYVPSELTYETPYRLPEEGLYKLSLSYRRSEPYVAYFVVDQSAPTPREARISQDGDTDWMASYEDGHTEVVGGMRTIEIEVPDLLGGTQERAFDDAGRPTTAGTKSVSLVIPHKADPSKQEWDELPATVQAQRKGNTDTWLVTLAEPGVYDVADAKVVAVDGLGNELSMGHAPTLASLLDKASSHPSVIHVIPSTQDDPTVAVHGAQDVDVSNPGYYKGGIRVSVSVPDPWIDVYRHVSGYADGVVSYDIIRGEVPYEGDKPILSLAELSDEDGDGVWTHDYWLQDPGSDPGSPLPIEGAYTLHAEHRWWGGTTSSALTPNTFVADHTPPTMGRLVSSATEPLLWGYVFVDGTETLSIAVSDGISGIDAATVTSNLAGPTQKQPKATYDPLGSIISVTLAGDAQRLFLEGSSMGIRDMAGNETSMPSLAGLVDLGLSNLPKGTVGIVIDAVPPTLTVSYDNMNARNGRYYNAQRVATFTLVESNFDLVKANDASREVVSVACDGRAHPITAGQFENPSGDGVTWVAQEALATDGDWTIDGHFVDPAGHPANGIHDEFTIDTTPPMLTVDFDNDDVRNGRYYNRGRTATVTVVERNPQDPPASITTQATDASGAAAGSPGVSGWRQTDQQHAWAATVGFFGELRYALSATATDLAGNEAMSIEVPEFVIDMTAPELEIGHVDDQAAYAGTIAPTVKMSDDNYDLSASDYTLTGAHSGKLSYLPGMDSSLERTGESVSYADFERTLERDDVYTLAAHAQDLAGNSTDQSKVFSVNRFGSNYLYSDDTAELRGSYVQTPRDVVVTEVNVSGLVSKETVVELVRDNEVLTLSEGDDYRIDEGDDAGWSATTYTVPASTFDCDAYYRLLITSRDRAGNLSQNTMDDKDADRTGVASVSFAVDRTRPTVGFAGVSSNAVYFGPSRDALPLVSDNLELEGAMVQLDGEEPVEYTAEQLASGELSCLVPSDARYHSVTVTARDRAGNVRVATASDVVVAANWGEFLGAHPRILFGLVAATLFVVGTLAASIVLAIRHHRRTEPIRNPFGH